MTLLERLLLNKLSHKKGGSSITVHDDYSESTTEPYSANYVNTELNKIEQIEKNAGAHNSIYRGKDITDLFYDGTLSSQIAAGTFDDIFVGDYIIGNESGIKYLVADINYLYNTGNTPLTTNHVLMIPERCMGQAKMNTNGGTTGGYLGCEMHTTSLNSFKTIIQNDFGSSHILTHQEILTNAVSSGKASGWDWADVTVEIMSEVMIYGHNVWASAPSYESGVDRSQLSLFKHRHDLITALKSSTNENETYWLRDIVSSSDFAAIYSSGITRNSASAALLGVRPAFLVY